MTPKDKGYQIYESYFIITTEWMENDECVKFAKQCALICVDNIMDALCTKPSADDSLDYWEQVKSEIELLC